MTDVIDVVMAGIGPPGDLEGEVGGDLQGTISSASIKPGAVTTSKLADGAVTAAKVAPDVATQVELDAVTDDLASEAADRAAADALLIPLAQKGVANGVATLGADSKIPGPQLPALAIGEIFTVGSQAAMLALTAQRGDVAIRTDLDPDGFFLLTADDPTTLANWVQITAPNAVTSVNGLTGVVNLLGVLVGVSNDETVTGQKTLQPASAPAGKPILILKGAPGQSGPFIEFLNSSNQVLHRWNYIDGLFSNYKIAAGTLGNFSWLGLLNAISKEIGVVTMLVKGFLNQTASLQEWRSSTDAVLMKVNPNGEPELVVPSTGMIFRTPNGTRMRLLVDNDGAVVTEVVV